MQLGIQVPSFTWAGAPETIGSTLVRIARRAEQAGFYSFWAMDHFFQIPSIGSSEHEMLESYSTLAFVAGQTERLKLGTLVTGVTYRYPGLLIKTVTTLDVLSGGRAYLGIGAAWNEEEHIGLGVPFPPLKERFERLEETLQIAHRMWAGDEQPYNGRHYHLARPLNSPNALQKPHPPILIGGSGEQKTLRLVSRYADACNFFGRMGLDQLRRKLDVLREHCATEGRPYDAIEKTTLSTLHLTRDGRDGTTTPDQAIEHFHQLAELGISHAIINMPNVADDATWDVLASDVVPAVQKIKAARS